MWLKRPVYRGFKCEGKCEGKNLPSHYPHHLPSHLTLPIKVIESYGIFKSTIRFKLMHSLVCHHRTKVLDKTKITDLSKKFCSLG